MSDNAKKFALSAVVVAGIVAFIIYRQMQPATSTNQQEATKETTTPPGITYRDGEYTGKLTDAFFGPMQVKAVIRGGKITDVIFLQYPNSPGHTTEISNATLPKLKSETIAAQSANVDMISGATQDVDAFRESMADALKQAQG